MESPTVVVERERERVASSPGFLRRHKLLVGIVIFVGILVYAAFNLWIYERAKSGRRETITSGAGFGGFQSESQGRIPTPAPRLTPEITPTPTPRPTGPGEYACDPYGVCNKYSEEARKQYCGVTYADSECLDQCGDKTKQCTL